jgi:hypothetical protein
MGVGVGEKEKGKLKIAKCKLQVANSESGPSAFFNLHFSICNFRFPCALTS